MINDKRCIFCNWLNREIGDSYVCENCKKQNNIKEIEVEVDVIKKSKSNLNTVKRRY